MTFQRTSALFKHLCRLTPGIIYSVGANQNFFFDAGAYVLQRTWIFYSAGANQNFFFNAGAYVFQRTCVFYSAGAIQTFFFNAGAYEILSKLSSSTPALMFFNARGHTTAPALIQHLEKSTPRILYSAGAIPTFKSINAGIFDSAGANRTFMFINALDLL